MNILTKIEAIEKQLNSVHKQERTDKILFLCKSGDLKNLKKIIGHEKLVTSRSRKGKNGLYLACENGHLEVVKYLIIKVKVKINEGHENDFDDGAITITKSPLYVAIQQNHDKIVDFLINQEGINLNNGFMEYSNEMSRGMKFESTIHLMCKLNTTSCENVKNILVKLAKSNKRLMRDSNGKYPYELTKDIKKLKVFKIFDNVDTIEWTGFPTIPFGDRFSKNDPCTTEKLDKLIKSTTIEVNTASEN